MLMDFKAVRSEASEAIALVDGSEAMACLLKLKKVRRRCRRRC